MLSKEGVFISLSYITDVTGCLQQSAQWTPNDVQVADNFARMPAGCPFSASHDCSAASQVHLNPKRDRAFFF
jgi:hypothetical protein